MMKKDTSFIYIFFLLSGCSTFSFHPSNLDEEQANSIFVGMKVEEFRSLSDVPAAAENYTSDGSKLEYYTADFEKGSMIWCRTLAIKISDGVIVEKTYVDIQNSNQTRCNLYSAVSQANSDSWTNSLNQLNQSLGSYNEQVYGRNLSSQRKFCYYGRYSNEPICFHTLDQCQAAIEVYNFGACTVE
jgi:hypothetical protein